MFQISEKSAPQRLTPEDFYSHTKKNIYILRYVPCSPELWFGLFCIILLKFCREYYSAGFLKPFPLTGFCQGWCQSIQNVQICWHSRCFEIFIVLFLIYMYIYIYIKNFTLVGTEFVLFLFSFPWQRLKVSWNGNCGLFSNNFNESFSFSKTLSFQVIF